MISSVIASLKYSCDGSPLELTNGSTASRALAARAAGGLVDAAPAVTGAMNR
jgi:hypothetical protein